MGDAMNERLKEMAFEAGLTITPCGLFEAEDTNLERFAELVLQNYVSQIMTTEEREQFIRDDERAKCAADYLQDCCDAVDAARLEEREACVKLLDDFTKTEMVPAKDTWRMGVMAAANAVRDKK